MNSRSLLFLAASTTLALCAPAHGQITTQTEAKAEFNRLVDTHQDPATLDASPDGVVKGSGIWRAKPEVLLPNVVVRFRPGFVPYIASTLTQTEVVGQARSRSDVFLLQARSVAEAQVAVQNLRRDTSVLFAVQDRLSSRVRTQFVPNDPYLQKDIPAAGWPGQWYLRNNLGTGIDVKVDPAYIANYTGTGVVIGIIDDGVQYTQSDLKSNYLASESWDFGQGDADPAPVYDDDVHGTAVAGLAAARGGNGVGICGTAPYAKYAGLRVDFVNGTDSQFADATTYHSTTGVAPTIKIKNHSYGYSDPYITSDLELAALADSAGSTAINVFSAGNERGFVGQDCNKQALQASTNAITVTAVGSDGVFAPYSSFGANVMCCAPSSSPTGAVILTTDRVGKTLGYNGAGDTFPNGDYTSLFGGTSASAPIVSGVMALTRQSWSLVNTRFAKHLLVLCSDVVDAGDSSVSSDGGWRANQQGKKFNQNYGFGLINADKLTTAARKYSRVTPVETHDTGVVEVGAAIPDNNATGITKTFTVSTPTPVEDIQVHLNITHPYRGDLEAYVTSARGTKRRMFLRSNTDSGADIDWTFTMNQFWSENPNGTWKIQIIDTAAADAGVWNSFQVVTHCGKLVPRSAVNSARYISQVVPTSMTHGTTATVTVKMQNTGNTVWTQADGYSLVSDNPAGNTTWGLSSVAIDPAESIRPSMYKTWTFSITAPSVPGNYVFQWKVAKAGAGFNAPSATTTITVN